jgi:hypothetical protein
MADFTCSPHLLIQTATRPIHRRVAHIIHSNAHGDYATESALLRRAGESVKCGDSSVATEAETSSVIIIKFVIDAPTSDLFQNCQWSPYSICPPEGSRKFFRLAASAVSWRRCACQFKNIMSAMKCDAERSSLRLTVAAERYVWCVIAGGICWADVWTVYPCIASNVWPTRGLAEGQRRRGIRHDRAGQISR